MKEELSLTGSVSSMVVKDGTLNFYYAKDGALHLATASATDGWVDALADAGQVLQLPDGVNNGTGRLQRCEQPVPIHLRIR